MKLPDELLKAMAKAGHRAASGFTHWDEGAAMECIVAALAAARVRGWSFDMGNFYPNPNEKGEG